MAAQKPFTAYGRGNQPAGEDPESNNCCLGFHDIRVITTLAVKFRDFAIILTGVMFQLFLVEWSFCSTKFASLTHKREHSGTT